MERKNIIRFWCRNARWNSLPQSMLPAILAVCMALGQEGFAWTYAVLAVFGCAVGHLGMNLFDDYFDYRKKGSEFRDKLAGEGIRSRIAKCSYITSGAVTIRQLLYTCLIFGGIAFVIGWIIFLKRGETILYIALITALLGISYSGDPVRLSYRGFGELQVGFMFGPLLMTGVYYAACGHLDASVWFISIPVGMLVANILYTHSIMDFEPDKKVGKMTLAVLLNNKQAMLVALGLMLFVPFGIVVYGVWAGYLIPLYYIVLLTLPMAAGLFYLMVQYIRYPKKTFQPAFWMGPMTDWQRVEGAGIGWFMIRWYLARNLLSFFCLIIIVIGLIRL